MSNSIELKNINQGRVLDDYLENASIYKNNYFQWSLLEAFLSKSHLLLEISFANEDIQREYQKKSQRIQLIHCVEIAIHLVFTDVFTRWYYVYEGTDEDAIESMARDIAQQAGHVILVYGVDQMSISAQSLFYSKILLAQLKDPCVIIPIVHTHYYETITSTGRALTRYPSGNQLLSNIFISRHHLYLSNYTDEEIYTQLHLSPLQQKYIDYCSNIDTLNDNDEYELSKHNHKRFSLSDLQYLLTNLSKVSISYPIRTHLQNLMLYITTHNQVIIPPTADTLMILLNALKIATLLDGYRFSVPKHVFMIDEVLSNRLCIRYMNEIPPDIDPVYSFVVSVHKKLPPII